MNTVQIVGRIASQVRYGQIPVGDTMRAHASFLLAIRRPVSKSRSSTDEPEWIPVDVWGAQADRLVQYNGKGSRIGIKGRLRGRFLNEAGTERGSKLWISVVADEITYLSPRKEGTQSPPSDPAPSGRRR